jgi:hypothetical protein
VQPVQSSEIYSLRTIEHGDRGIYPVGYGHSGDVYLKGHNARQWRVSRIDENTAALRLLRRSCAAVTTAAAAAAGHQRCDTGNEHTSSEPLFGFHDLSFAVLNTPEAHSAQQPLPIQTLGLGESCAAKLFAYNDLIDSTKTDRPR